MGVRSTTVWVAIAAARAASADPPQGEDARAVALFEEGRALIKAGQVAEACDRFNRSYKIEYAVGTALNLGDCLEKLGQVRAAYQMFVDTEAMERAHAGRRAGYAHDRATALAAKLGTVTVRIADPDLVGMTVTIGGHAVHPTGEFRDLYEPGPVEVVASAPGRVEFRASANAVANTSVEIAVPALAVQPVEPAPAPPVVHPGGSVVAPQPEPVALERRPSRVRLAWVSGGVGAAAAVTGLALGLYGRSQYLDQFSSGHCSGRTECDPVGVTNIDHANRIADIGTIVGAAGAALAIAGVVIYVTSPRDRITVAATPHGLGLALQGGF